jgi:hypothetical protein
VCAGLTQPPTSVAFGGGLSPLSVPGVYSVCRWAHRRLLRASETCAGEPLLPQGEGTLALSGGRDRGTRVHTEMRGSAGKSQECIQPACSEPPGEHKTMPYCPGGRGQRAGSPSYSSAYGFSRSSGGIWTVRYGGSSMYSTIDVVPTNPHGDFSTETYWSPPSVTHVFITCSAAFV